MPANTIAILEGNAFVVSDLAGNIDASPSEPVGLFAWDTRFLSKWILTIDGKVPNVLSTDDLQYYSAQFFLVPGTGTIYVDADLSIMRRRDAGNGFREEILIRNEKPQATDLEVRLEAAADFADLFEVKDQQQKKGELYQRAQRGLLILGYRRETYVRETWITSSVPATMDRKGLRYRVHLGPHEEWKTTIDVRVPARPGSTPDSQPAELDSGVQPDGATRRAKDLRTWMITAPRLTSDWPPMERIYQRSMVDLAAIRFFPGVVPGGALPAAGLPWFMSIFGRDSILTSFQALPFVPELAVTTLRALAAWQGTRRDDFRDEEPGKILHELRYGELTAFEERPHCPYYGAADVTPLFIVLLDEVERWTGDRQLVEDLEVEARAALNWIDEFGDHNGDGYVDYERRRDTGLENQCWKDSWNSILFSDGSNSRLPRATAEIQGYVYDAKRRGARLARSFWNDPELANRLESQAQDLKTRFNQDYWLPDRQYFALAIDGAGRKVDSLTSNIGQLLWSGIADRDHATACAEHLMGDQLFSGWGVRTMGAREGAYNPIGYHLGTIWPHDNSFIALGLAQYGYREAAGIIAMGILEAATYFRHRLPEAFAGYPRELTRFPVQYPTACSPQAWATGAPLLLLRVLLGLEPVGDRLIVDAVIPTQIGWLQILDIPGRWGRTDAFGRTRESNP
jgi:glycogen debranching enzyme